MPQAVLEYDKVKLTWVEEIFEEYYLKRKMESRVKMAIPPNQNREHARFPYTSNSLPTQEPSPSPKILSAKPSLIFPLLDISFADDFLA
ncbi:hypothetical protein [Streptococcus sp. DD10]|uniref:hypothetical protein n=1 Tax=Streptococcus sp. DD10 TaxID=1777878 RepID=UPI0018D3A0DB|nr:hypothetical protein [Streptococcus sp. DD10]